MSNTDPDTFDTTHTPKADRYIMVNGFILRRTGSQLFIDGQPITAQEQDEFRQYLCELRPRVKDSKGRDEGTGR